MKKVTDESEIRKLLSVDNKWVIYRKVDDWKEQEFNLNKQDVDDIIGDLKKDYFYESQRPVIVQHNDGQVIVKYPTCRLEGR